MKLKTKLTGGLMALMMASVPFSAEALNLGQVTKIQYPGYSYEFTYDNSQNCYFFKDCERAAYADFVRKIFYPNNSNKIIEYSYMSPKGEISFDNIMYKQEVTNFAGQNKINVVETFAPNSAEDSFSTTTVVDNSGSSVNGEQEAKFSWKGGSISKVTTEDETITFKYSDWDYQLKTDTPDWMALLLTHYLGNASFLDYWYAGCTFQPFKKLPSEITYDDNGKKETYKFDYYLRQADGKPFIYIEVKTVVNGSMTKRDKINVYFR